MRIGAKIGIGVFIIVACISAILVPGVITKADADGDGFIGGTAGNEVAVGKWGINVTPPTYTETFYEKGILGDEYRVYESRRGYHFALVKIKAINHGKEEDNPYFHDIKLVTTEGLRYKEKSGFNYSYKTLKSPPTPLLKEFKTYHSVLPRESSEGYFYFQVPVKAVAEDLLFEYGFKYGRGPEVRKVRIKLRPTPTPTPASTPGPTPTPTPGPIPGFEFLFAVVALPVAYLLRILFR